MIQMLKLENKGSKPDTINTFQNLKLKFDTMNNVSSQKKNGNYI